jgi:hypothetical protein
METKKVLFDLSGTLDRKEEPEEITAYHKPLDKPKTTASGYGKKLPTPWVIYRNNRKQRVYCDIYSNIGNSYVIINGQKVSID